MTSSKRLALPELSEAKFDLDLMGIVTGARRTGKTVAVKELLHRWADCFAGGTLFCESAHLNGDYDGIFPPEEIHTTVTDEKLRRIVKQQDDKVSERGRGKYRWLILFDDMSYGDILKTSQTMRLIVRNGRHRGICCIITAQDIIDVPTTIRANSELLVCAHTIDRRNLDIMHKVWGGMVDPMQFRTLLFQACAEAVPESGDVPAGQRSRPDHIDLFCVNKQCRSQNPMDYFFHLHANVGRCTPFGTLYRAKVETARRKGLSLEAASKGLCEVSDSESEASELRPRLSTFKVVKKPTNRSWDDPATHICPVCLHICTAQPARHAATVPGPPGCERAPSQRRQQKRKRRRRSSSKPSLSQPAAASAPPRQLNIRWPLAKETLKAVRSSRG